MKIERMNKGSWGKVRAFFDLSTKEGFTIKGFKLIEGINGLFVSVPSQKGKDEEWYETIWIESKELREKLNKILTDECYLHFRKKTHCLNIVLKNPNIADV